MRICLFNKKVKNKFQKIKDNFRIVGLNTGNLLFWHAIEKLLHAESHSVEDCIENKVDLDSFDGFVTTDLIWIKEDVSHAYVLKQLDIAGDRPIVPISVGLQAPVYKKDFRIHPDTVNLLARISERSVLGLRGNYTAEILDKYGIKNVAVIGCPSLYYNMYENYKIEHDNSPIKNVSCNFRSFHSKLSFKEIEFLKYCSHNEYSFCEQTQQPFSLDICTDIKDFKYIYNWLNLNKFLFFNINDWTQFSSSYQFSMGSRFHGNVVSLWNNKPALFVVIDSRTKEMTELFSLPSISIDQFDSSKDIRYYYDMADYTKFNRDYPTMCENFISFLNANKLL